MCIFRQLEKAKQDIELGLVVEHWENQSQKNRKEFAAKPSEARSSAKSGTKNLKLLMFTAEPHRFLPMRSSYFKNTPPRQFFIGMTRVLMETGRPRYPVTFTLQKLFDFVGCSKYIEIERRFL